MNKNLTPDKINSVEDRDIENTMGTLLRTGVISAAVLVFIGAVYYLLKNGTLIPDYSTFRGESEEFSTLGGIFKSFISLHSRGIIMLGLLVLILTPIARVLFSLIAFTLEKDYIYTVISTVVLIILLLSFFNLL